MKFYSELLDKLYDSTEQLTEEETAYLKKKADAEAKKAAKNEQPANLKKELAKAIEDADAELDDAYEAYKEAKQTCNEMWEETRKLVADIMQPATQIVKTAQAKRLEAIQNFNKEFGAFRTTYTGDKAQKEFERCLSDFDSLFKQLFGI